MNVLHAGAEEGGKQAEKETPVKTDPPPGDGDDWNMQPPSLNGTSVDQTSSEPTGGGGSAAEVLSHRSDTAGMNGFRIPIWVRIPAPWHLSLAIHFKKTADPTAITSIVLTSPWRMKETFRYTQRLLCDCNGSHYLIEVTAASQNTSE